jgi:hypothetical protein
MIFLSFSFIMQVQCSSPTSSLNNLLVAMDVDLEDLINVSLGDSEAGCAAVQGRIGLLEPVKGDSFLFISNGEAEPNLFPEGWVGTPEDSLSIYNYNPNGTGPLGEDAYDITTLNVRLRAPEWANSFSFNFRFMSEEYPYYVGQDYNDFFSCLLDGTNIVFDTEGNIINVNNNFFDPDIIPEGTVFNATTVLLTAKAPIEAGSVFDLEFMVGDVGDEILDSAVFIDNFHFSGEQVFGVKTEPTKVFDGNSLREARSLSVVAVVGFSVTAVTALLAGLGPSISAAISNLPIPSQLRNFLKFYGASIFQKVDKVKLEALEKAPFFTKGEIGALGISVLIITFVYSFVEANGLDQFLNPSILAAIIPSTFVSVVIITSTKVLSDAFCAGTAKVYRNFSLWVTGVITFIVSGLFFLFPFSSPGVTRYQSLGISPKTKGLIILSKTLILLTLTVPFSLLFMMGFRVIGDTGVLLTLMSACYSLVPLKYLSGKAVFDYRKDLSLFALALTSFLFISFTVNLFHILVYLPVGVVSSIMAVFSLREIKRAP